MYNKYKVHVFYRNISVKIKKESDQPSDTFLFVKVTCVVLNSTKW